MADVLMGIHFFQAEHRIQFISRPMRFLGFPNHEKGAPRQEISKWSAVCSIFSRSWWNVVRSASLAKGGTSKKRPSPHLHKIPARSNKLSPRTLQSNLAHCLLRHIRNFCQYEEAFPSIGNLAGLTRYLHATENCIKSCDKFSARSVRMNASRSFQWFQTVSQHVPIIFKYFCIAKKGENSNMQSMQLANSEFIRPVE
jgi:hypothetical protein